MRRKAKRDANESVLAEAARQLGASVTFLNDPYVGDLLIGFQNRNYLIEVKNKYGKQRLGQIEFQEHWCGQYAVVKTVEELLQILTTQ